MKAANPALLPAWPCRVVVTINKKRNLVVSVEDGATFEIVLHRTWKGSAVHQDFLGFYVLHSFRMSARTQGLLGMTGQPGRTVCWCSEASVCSWVLSDRLISRASETGCLVRALSLLEMVTQCRVRQKLSEPGDDGRNTQLTERSEVIMDLT